MPIGHGLVARSQCRNWNVYHFSELDMNRKYVSLGEIKSSQDLVPRMNSDFEYQLSSQITLPTVFSYSQQYLRCLLQENSTRQA